MKTKKLFLVIIAAILVIAGVVTCVLLLGKNDNSEVTVYFETNGGYELEPIKLMKGEKLEEEPVTSKVGNTFLGWYTDEECKNRFYVKDKINSDTKLYASFMANDDEVIVDVTNEVYLNDIASDYSFTLITTLNLTNITIANYLSLEVISGENVSLNVEKSNDGFLVSPKGSYTKGGVYRFTILNDKIKFLGQPNAINILTIRIHKDKIEKMDHSVNGYKTIRITDLLSEVVDTDGYLLPVDRYHLILPATITEEKNLKVGDTVLFADETDLPGPGSFFVNIVSLEKQGTMYFINVVDSTLDDVLGDVDVYIEDDIDINKGAEKINLNEVVDSLYKSEGTRKLTALFASALISSPTVKEIGDDTPLYDESKPYSFSDYANKEHGASIAVESLVEGLTITAFLGSATNSNFPNITPNEWAALEISFHYEAQLKNKVSVDATITITQYLHATLQGYKHGTGLNIDFDYAINLYTQTDIEFTVLVSITDLDDDKKDDKTDDKKEDEKKKIDISLEIGSMISGEEDPDETNIVEQMKSLLDEKGDKYIDICRVPMYKGSYPLIPQFPIFSLNAKVEFIIKFKFAAGIKTKLSILDAVQIGIVGNTKRKEVDTYKNVLLGAGRFSLDFFACGYLGIRAGFGVTLTVSIYSLDVVGEIGAKVEVGAYLDIYGYVHFYLAKLQQYDDYLDKSLQGGLYFIIGIYFQIDLVVNSVAFNVQNNFTLLNKAIPLVTFGDKWILLGLKVPESDIFMNKNEIDIRSLNLLEGKYLDITTGETDDRGVSIDKLHIWFDLRYLEYNKKTGKISVNKSQIGYFEDGLSRGDLTFETEMTVVYSGQIARFYSKPDPSGIVLVGKVKIVWVDESLEINDVKKLDETCLATLYYDCDGVKTKITERRVQIGKSLGGFDVSEVFKYHVATTGWDENPNNAVLTEDKTFTVYVTKMQVRVGFIYFDGENWVSEIWPVEVGTMPVIPEEGQKSFTTERVFIGWKGVRCQYTNAGAIDETFYDVRVIPENVFGYAHNFVLDKKYDVTVPLEKVVGTEKEAYDLLTEEFDIYGACYYVAQYKCVKYPVSITVLDDGLKPVVRDYLLDYGDNANKYNLANISNRLTIIGWDFNDDGVVDYTDTKDFPMVTKEQNIKAVYTDRLVDVHVYDINGTEKMEKAKAYQVNDLNELGAIKNYIYPDDEDIRFQNFEYSNDGITWYKVYNENRKIFVRDELFVRGQFDYYYDIKVIGDFPSGRFSETVKVKGGTLFSPRQLIGETAMKEEDGRFFFTHEGWIDLLKNEKYPLTDKFVVTNDMIIQPYFQENYILYTMTVNCPNGIVPGHDSSMLIIEDLIYDQMREKLDYYIENLPEQSIVGEDVYTYYTVDNFTEANHNILVVYKYKQTKLEHTLTFNSGDGLFSDGENQREIQPYYSNSSFPMNLIEKPAQQSLDKIYEFVGWKDSNDIIYKETDIYSGVGDMTFTAVYEYVKERTYTITFITDKSVFSNNEKIIQLTGEYDQLVTPIDLPISVDIEGYSYTASGYDKQLPEKFTEDLTINVIWTSTIRKFMVTYYLDNVLYDEKEYTYQESLQELPAPVSDDKTFSGWVWQHENTAFSKMPETMPAYDLTVHGKFISYYVIYKVGESQIKKIQVPAGKTITLDDLPFEEGYSYSNWMTTDIEVNDGMFTMPKSDVVLTTTKTINSYIVKYILDEEEIEVKTYKYKELVTIKELPKQKLGYTFSGWSSNDVAIISNSFMMPSNDVIINGEYIINSYTVYYKVNGEVKYQDTVKYNSIVTLREDEIEEGYIFSGWNIPSSINLIEGKFTMIDSDVIIESTLTKGQYNVTIYIDGSTQAYSVFKANFNEEVLLSVTLDNHLEIDEWKSNDVIIINNKFTMISKDVSINLITKYKEFTVKYLEEINGKTVIEEKVKYNDPVTVDNQTWVRRGKIIESWTLYSGIASIENGSFNMPANDVVFIGNSIKYLTIDDGVNYDKYDTTNQTVLGFLYDTDFKILTIYEPNLTISGEIDDCQIYVDTDSVTFSNLKIASSSEGYYYQYYKDDFFNYYKTEIDATIIFNRKEEMTINVNIEGLVDVSKNRNYDYETVAAISTICDNCSMYVPEERYNLEMGKIIINGLEDSRLIVNSQSWGIYTFLSLEINNLDLDITANELGIKAGDLLINDSKLVIYTEGLDPYSIDASSELAASLDLNLTFVDCELDLKGTISSECDYIFSGNTFGSITSIKTVIRSEGDVCFELAKGNILTFKTTSEEKALIEIINGKNIIFDNNNNYINVVNPIFTNSLINHGFRSLGTMDNDNFVLLKEVAIGYE